jgi:hypothetical protein
MTVALTYAIDRENGTVTVYLPGAVKTAQSLGLPVSAARSIELDESELITLLSDLQGVQAYDADAAGYL